VINASDEHIVMRPARVHQSDKQQGHDPDGDAKDPQPARRAGVGGQIGHADSSHRSFENGRNVR
jgi:hypothetical protein